MELVPGEPTLLSKSRTTNVEEVPIFEPDDNMANIEEVLNNSDGIFSFQEIFEDMGRLPCRQTQLHFTVCHPQTNPICRLRRFLYIKM